MEPGCGDEADGREAAGYALAVWVWTAIVNCPISTPAASVFIGCEYHAMTTPPIDLTSLRKALAQFREAIGFWQACKPVDPLKPHLRSAVIQSFEFTYELAVRSTRRVLIERA